MLATRKRRRRTRDKNMFRRQAIVGVVLTLVVGLLGSGIWYGTRLNSLTIQSVAVTEGETVDADKIKERVLEMLEGNHYAIIPKKFAWLYPEEAIKAAVMEEGRIKSAHIDIIDGVLKIGFEEYVPAALWCDTKTIEECVYLDETGYAFASAPPLRGGAYLRYIEMGNDPVTDTEAFPQSFMELSKAIKDTVYRNLNFNIIFVERLAEDEAVYRFAGGGEIKVSLRAPIDETLDNFRTILTSSDYEHLQNGNFEYIDLRYGNKVFILEEPIDTATTTEEE